MDSEAEEFSQTINTAERELQKETFELNSSRIFLALQNQWKNFDRQVVLKLEDLFMNNATAHEIISERYNEGEQEYFKNYLEFRYPSARRTAQNTNFFPFPSYFLINIEEDPYPSIISYETFCIIEKQDPNFNHFFALKISLTDIMEMEEFLNYHLEASFENDIDLYENFLQLISQKFEEILKDRIRIIERYISNRLSEVRDIHLKQSEKAKQFTTSRQVLAMFYLFEYIRIYDGIDKTHLAEFIQFMTGKETGVNKINDTTIYKKIRSPLPAYEKTLLKDLEFILPYFEKLGLDEIVAKIKKELR